MAMAVVYSNFCGTLVHENRGGEERDYMPDPLGSTVALLDSNQTMTDTWEYWPYGEVATRTGSNATPFTFVGVLGYFKDILDKLFYVRARYYQPNYTRWVTADPLWPEEKAYEYAGVNPVNYNDPLGATSPKKTKLPTCQEVSDCLKSHKDRCGSVKSGRDSDASISLALCLFWQESNLGENPGPGGMGRCTKACFDELIRRGCSWLEKFKNYNDFVENATWCEKARAGFDFLATVGLDRYGPGPGRPGDYRGPTGCKIRECESCLKASAASGSFSSLYGLPTPSVNSYCNHCFTTYVHK